MHLVGFFLLLSTKFLWELYLVFYYILVLIEDVVEIFTLFETLIFHLAMISDILSLSLSIHTFREVARNFFMSIILSMTINFMKMVLLGVFSSFSLGGFGGED